MSLFNNTEYLVKYELKLAYLKNTDIASKIYTRDSERNNDLNQYNFKDFQLDNNINELNELLGSSFELEYSFTKDESKFSFMEQQSNHSKQKIDSHKEDVISTSTNNKNTNKTVTIKRLSDLLKAKDNDNDDTKICKIASTISQLTEKPLNNKSVEHQSNTTRSKSMIVGNNTIQTLNSKTEESQNKVKSNESKLTKLLQNINFNNNKITQTENNNFFNHYHDEISSKYSQMEDRIRLVRESNKRSSLLIRVNVKYLIIESIGHNKQIKKDIEVEENATVKDAMEYAIYKIVIEDIDLNQTVNKILAEKKKTIGESGNCLWCLRITDETEEDLIDTDMPGN